MRQYTNYAPWDQGKNRDKQGQNRKNFFVTVLSLVVFFVSLFILFCPSLKPWNSHSLAWFFIQTFPLFSLHCSQCRDRLFLPDRITVCDHVGWQSSFTGVTSLSLRLHMFTLKSKSAVVSWHTVPLWDSPLSRFSFLQSYLLPKATKQSFLGSKPDFINFLKNQKKSGNLLYIY